MRRLALLFIAMVALLAAAPAGAATLPLQALVPDAAEIQITPDGFDFLSAAATDILAGMDLEGMLMGMNPIFEMSCTDLFFTHLQMSTNFTQANLDNLGVEVATTQLMGLDYVQNALYFRLWMEPTAGLPMLRIDFTGLQGTSGCTDPFNAYAEISIDPLEIGGSVTLDYSPTGKGFDVVIHQVKVNLNNLNVTLNGFPAGLDSWIEELLLTLLPDLIEEMAPDLINELIAEQLANVQLSGDVAVGDYTLHYAFDPDFSANNQGFNAVTDGNLYIAGTTIDPCIGGGYSGSPYTDNPLPEFGSLTPGGEPYHFGLALSDDILNQLLFSFVAKGELCLMFPWDLTLAAFEGMIPGWTPPAKYEDEANMIDLYPLDTPRFVVGQGASDLALVIQPYRLDWYIQKEQRYVEMLTAEIDINLALSMDTDAENNLIITLEGTDISFDVWGSEFNILPPAAIETLINSIIDVFLPMIVDLIPPIPLPNLLGYQFAINEIGAMGDGNDYFGLYCEFIEPTEKGPAAAFDLPIYGLATNLVLDGTASARAGLAAVTHPKLHLAAAGRVPVDHFLVRIDGAAWRRVDGDVFDLTYLLEGRHVIEAAAVSPRGLVSRQPARLSFVLDRVAPRLDRARLSAKMVLELAAHDYVAAAKALRFQVRVPGNDWSRPFAATTVRVVVPPGTNEIDVRVIDPAGNATAPRRVRATVTPPARALIRQ